MAEDSDKFYEDIDSYLHKIELNLPIDVSELDFIVNAMVTRTSFTKQQSEILLAAFFNEIRAKLYDGVQVTFGSRRLKLELTPNEDGITIRKISKP